MAAAVAEDLVRTRKRTPRAALQPCAEPLARDVPETLPTPTAAYDVSMIDAPSLDLTERLNEHWIDPELGDGVPTGTAMIELVAFLGILVLSIDAVMTLAAGQALNAGHWFVVALMSVGAVVTIGMAVRRAVRRVI